MSDIKLSETAKAFMERRSCTSEHPRETDGYNYCYKGMRLASWESRGIYFGLEGFTSEPYVKAANDLLAVAAPTLKIVGPKEKSKNIMVISNSETNQTFEFARGTYLSLDYVKRVTLQQSFELSKRQNEEFKYKKK